VARVNGSIAKTAVVVLKSNTGASGETVRVGDVECRHEPERRRLVLHRNGNDVARFDTRNVERWYMDYE
jgi:hypothetical protein